MRGRYLPIIGFLVFFAVLIGVIVTLSPEAEAVVTYTNNEDSDNALWIEPPASLDEVEIWRRSGGNINQDWWKFNVSGGQLVQINFRKYDRFNDFEPPFEGGTYLMNYRVYDAGLNEVYRYSRTYDNPPNDLHRRDMWSHVVPDGTIGPYYVWVFVATNQNRDHAYYWMNVSVEDVGDMNTVSHFSGTLDVNASYTADYDPIDMFKVDLTAGPTTADMVTLDFSKTEADVDLVLEVWEVLPFGSGENWHMVNRTTSGLAVDIPVKFVADHTGTYLVRITRDFWNTGSTNYTLDVSIGSKAHDGDNLPDDGMEILHVQKLRDRTIEMGYDTHDWYKVQVLAGDMIFKVEVDINDPDAEFGLGYEVVVYNETGRMLWAGSSVRSGPSYFDSITVPPSGTTTIFDFDEVLYVRFSADAGVTDRGFEGFRSKYDINFVLTNRVPELIVPFNGTYEWDEDGGINLFLDSHFYDPDGDKMEYFLLNRTSGWSYDVAGLTYWGWMNITSPPDWSGNETWTLKAQDEGQTGNDHRIFIDFTFIVHPVPDLPISNGSLYRQIDEEETTTADLRKLFYDVDDGPGGVITFGYTDTGVTEVEVVLDEVTGAVELIPGPDVFGDFTFEFFAVDDNDVPVTGTIDLRVIGINDIPRITAPIETVQMYEGGDEVEVDMSLYFHDVDGEALTYTYLVPTADQAFINVYHKNNVITEHRVVIELIDDGYYGAILVNVTCKDEEDTLVKQNMLIVVSNVPDPPSIDYFPVGNPSPIEETDSITFKVTDVLDADLPEFGLHTYTWYFDDVLVPDFNESEFSYTPGYDDAGTHTVRVIVTDPSGLEAIQEPVWTFQVTDKNRVPTVSITAETLTIDEGDKIIMTADGTDEDGDELTYNWYLIGGGEDKLLGTGMTLETKDLKAGSRMVEVVVTDGKGGEATDSRTIKVNAVEETSGIGMWLGIIVVVIIVIVIAVFMMMRGKGDAQPEASMDLDSLQQEYDPSQGRNEAGAGESYSSGEGEWESYEER
ncbi:MAG: hypothetical protein JSW25_05595 [Thermoplasmata archaeon]|nr:MAG: hypothetical protein JSW25_05595 [Thermoplasmata archaeon]